MAPERKIPPPPPAPATRYFCALCGELRETQRNIEPRHTSWTCRFLRWLDRI